MTDIDPAIANALHRDAIPLEERGYFLALIYNHIAMCAICAEMKARTDRGELTSGDRSRTVGHQE